jgi:prevent-host-death family protein
MEKTVSAADANRNFSKLLQGIRQGESYVVTSHGRPVARIAPAGEGALASADARTGLIKRLRSEPVAKIGRWKREDLYE